MVVVVLESGQVWARPGIRWFDASRTAPTVAALIGARFYKLRDLPDVLLRLDEPLSLFVQRYGELVRLELHAR